MGLFYSFPGLHGTCDTYWAYSTAPRVHMEPVIHNGPILQLPGSTWSLTHNPPLRDTATFNPVTVGYCDSTTNPILTSLFSTSNAQLQNDLILCMSPWHTRSMFKGSVHLRLRDV